MPACEVERCYCGFFKGRYDHNGSLKTERTEYPVCPHCGEYEYEFWDWDGLRDDGDSTEIYCGKCEKDYFVQLHLEHSFTTAFKEEDLEDW